VGIDLAWCCDGVFSSTSGVTRLVPELKGYDIGFVLGYVEIGWVNDCLQDAWAEGQGVEEWTSYISILLANTVQYKTRAQRFHALANNVLMISS
jgi:hypothetical protein